MSTMYQYQAAAAGGPLAIATVPKPVPGPNDVLIRTKAVGLNPVDAKSFYHGINVKAWPTVLGQEAAGVIEAVGEAVTAFQPGDEVVSGYATQLTEGSQCAAFQELIVVPQEVVARKPAALSFEEAASLPVTWITAAAAIVVGLGIPLPGLGTAKLDATNPPKSILVVGGSSGCGAHAVELLRFALGQTGAATTVVATSSPQHQRSLQALGASSWVSRADQGNTNALKAASPDVAGYDAIIDCVGAAAEQPQILAALREDGSRLFAEVFTGAQPTVPEGVDHKVIFGVMMFKMDGDANPLSYMTTLFDEGKYRLPVKVEIVGKGYDAIGEGIQTLHTGVSGTKLVVSL